MPADPRFHPTIGLLPLASLLAACGGGSDGPPAQMFRGVAALSQAGPDEVSFLDAAKHAAGLPACRAGAVVLRALDVALLPPGCIGIVVPSPAAAFAAIARLFHPVQAPHGARHPSAVIAGSADLASDVDVGAYAVIDDGARLGPGCVIHSPAVIGAGVVLGAGCIVHTHASISHAVCGARVTLHPGARIGQEGFGFTHTAQGFVTMPQLGRVMLEDGVEIGANTCIDRGGLGDTVIGAGSRIDNLVQIGHNVQLGRLCVMVALAGVSGSAVLEDGVMMAGQSGVAGHLRIGARARIGGQAGVIGDVPAGADVLGMPAQPSRDFLRQTAVLRRLAALPQKGEKGETDDPGQESDHRHD